MIDTKVISAFFLMKLYSRFFKMDEVRMHSTFPANIFLFKVTIEILEIAVKYKQLKQYKQLHLNK